MRRDGEVSVAIENSARGRSVKDVVRDRRIVQPRGREKRVHVESSGATLRVVEVE